MSAPIESAAPTDLPLSEELARAESAALRLLRRATEVGDLKLAVRASQSILQYAARVRVAARPPAPPAPPRVDTPAQVPARERPAPARRPASPPTDRVAALADRPVPASPLSAPLRAALRKISGC